MREDICTIPLSEVFEDGDGCPICRMRDMLSERITEYILGAAMMEPDVRIETNRLGFCNNHLSKMMKRHNRLQLGLILETHLQEINSDVFKKSIFGINSKKSAYKISKIEETCFICDKVEWGMQRLFSTLYRTYNNELDFRELFRNQDYICLPHYKMLVENAPAHLSKKPLSDFNEDCLKLTKGHLENLCEDVHAFTKMFDYRNAESETPVDDNVKNSILRAYEFLGAENGD
ncbi:MAG: hypothetical protein IIU65_06240 [Clostridia bacterium]|nr:hypothetical protein [Clostridia bacterium]